VQVCNGADGDLNGVLSRGSRRAGFGSTGTSSDGVSSKLWLQGCVGEDAVGCEEQGGGRIAISSGCSFKHTLKVGTSMASTEENCIPQTGNATSVKGKRGLRAWISGKK
jgi:hypothetical protein